MKAFKQMATSDEFSFAYDGEAVQSGEMDAALLATALFGLSSLCSDANRLLNGDRVEVSVRVRAGFKQGSFAVLIHLTQSAIETVKAFLGTSQFKDVEDILSVLGVVGEDLSKIGAGAGVVGGGAWGLFKLTTRIGNRKATVAEITPTTVTINIVGDVMPRQVNRTAWEMYQTPYIRQQADYVLGPLRHEGIQELRFEKNGEITGKVEKDEVPPLSSEADDDAVVKILDETPSERTWTIRQPSLDPDLKTWRFYEGKMPITATMSDQEFIGRVSRHEEGFFTGDILRVDIIATTKLTKGGYTRVDYNVVHVREHWHQENLPFPYEDPPKDH